MATKTTHYHEAIGRRKTATARVRLTPNSKTSIKVNNKSLEEYFSTEMYRVNVQNPLVTSEVKNTYAITVVVKGGGQSSQSEAVRHGISRALATLNPDARKPLKKAGFIKRDPRAKERKKPGLKKARKAGQWSKR